MENKNKLKKKWVTPQVQVLKINSQTTNGKAMGLETVMMGMISNGS